MPTLFGNPTFRWVSLLCVSRVENVVHTYFLIVFVFSVAVSDGALDTVAAPMVTIVITTD